LATAAGDILLNTPILARMRSIEGWLDEDEADLLIAGAARALSDLPAPCTVVEIGSYLGRSTAVLGSVVRTVRPDARVHAIDPHEGVLTGPHGPLMRVEPTLDLFRRTIADAGLEDIVEAIVQRSQDVRWAQPIAFLFIDGVHDSANIRGDFRHYEPWLVGGAYVAFHDYGRQLPSVKAFVDELVASDVLAWVALAGSLALLRYERPIKDARADAVPAAEEVVEPVVLVRIAQLSAFAAGRVLTARAGSNGKVDTKSSAVDVVTESDLLAEDAIRATIRRHRSHDAILGEERGGEPGDSSVRWLVDPLDGTANYLAGIAEWSISVAAEVDRGGGGVAAAVVHAPSLARTYSAIRGGGAWCNASRLPRRLPAARALHECVVCTGFAADLDRRRAQVAKLANVLPHVRDVRCRGAASLELCAVASGEADAYYEDGLGLWDVAAGRLIAAEAGAQVVGGPPLGPTPLVAAREPIAGALSELLGVGGTGEQ
jgi:myo-inositol-1(or 4)-monophosphatase